MALKVHHLRPAPGAKTAKTRVGSRRGWQGQDRGPRHQGLGGPPEHAARTSRAARCRCTCGCPKLRGFKNPFRVEYQIVNLARLGELFPEGGAVGVDDLVAAGAVRAGQPVKILGTGEISVAVQVSANAFSASAKEKIAAAGGSATEL